MEVGNDFFTPEDEEQLIGLVRGSPQVYDTQHAGYKDAEQKANAWKEIADYLNRTDEACKLKWKYIRDWYQRKKKEGKLPSGSGTLASKMRKRYEYLTFLDAATPSEQQHTGSNLVTVKEEKDAANDGGTQQQNSTPVDNEVVPNRRPGGIEITTLSEVSPRTPHDTRQPPKKRRKRHQNRPFHRQNLQQSTTASLGQQQWSTVDPLDAYFLAMASTVRQLPLHLQIKVKQDVLQVVSEAESEAAELSRDSSLLPQWILDQQQQEEESSNGERSDPDT